MKRLQRLRNSKHLRDLTAETEFTVAQLIQPLFVVENLKKDEPIKGLRGVSRLTESSVLSQIESDIKQGVTQFILFPVPASKVEKNLNHEFTTRVIRSIKEKFKTSICLWIDTCLCSYTTHGHCCIFKKSGERDHEATLNELSISALTFIKAGADGVSPSDMMDGRTKSIREALDANGFENSPIMSYSTKFCSQFYGPFRNAADSAPQFGDRTQYQLDVRNRTDALASSVRCAEEGADLLMVKPAMTSLDLIRPIFEKTGLQVGAYQVSGEYASLHLLSEQGLIDFNKALLETWHVLKRGGAQFIITYGARLAKELGVSLGK